MRASVGLARGESRYVNIARVLDLVSDQIEFRGRQQVLVKPNFVSVQRQSAVTHVDALCAVLDFVRARYDGRLIIAEGSALTSTWQGFERYGCEGLSDRYDAILVDLNADQGIPVQVYDRRMKLRTLRLARTVVESDLRISVGPPKTHDAVIVTLSLKNMIMGALINPAAAVRKDGPWQIALPRLARAIPHFVRQSRPVQWVKVRLLGHRSDKVAMHQGYPVINLNLAMLAPWVRPHVAVIDGFRAMEGAGPIDGDLVDWRVALAGVDALAVDSLTAWLMGFDPEQVGYLNYCRRLELGVGKLDRIDILGGVAPDAVRCRFRPHPAFHRQCDWHLEDVDRWLRPASRVQEYVA
jgi:uncharacterized protein (DUF362 family)